jgi:hypothetical protein
VAAAVWQRFFEDGLDTQAAAEGGATLRRALLEEGDVRGAAAALGALLGPGAVRREGGGLVVDLAHEAMQGVDPLVF